MKFHIFLSHQETELQLEVLPQLNGCFHFFEILFKMDPMILFLTSNTDYLP